MGSHEKFMLCTRGSILQWSSIGTRVLWRSDQTKNAIAHFRCSWQSALDRGAAHRLSGWLIMDSAWGRVCRSRDSSNAGAFDEVALVNDASGCPRVAAGRVKL